MSTSKTFRLFISSTFGDFRREREILQTKVFPHIRTYCSQQGFSFQPIDLRWGVSAEAQLDQKTLELCLEEVSACKTYPHPNFLIMAGDRYGWVPLPYAIEKEELETLRELITKDNKSINIEYKEYKHYPDPKNKDDYETRQKATRTTSDLELLGQWYILDENQLPPSYILKEREKDSDYEIYENWEAEEGALRTILQSAVNTSTLTEDQKRKYFLSATEAEVEEGIIPYLNETKKQQELIAKNPKLKEIDPQYIFGFFRDIDKSTQIENKFIENDQDYKKAQAFKGRVRSILPSLNILHAQTNQLDSESLEETYLIEFEEKMIAFLVSQINAKKEQEDQNVYTPLQIEQEAQSYFAEQKRENFIGQQTSLDTISEYIGNDDQRPLIIYGPSGRGKSSLMAQAIKAVQDAKQSEVVFRFVGATPHSGSSKEILTSIFEELGIDVRSEDEKETFEDFSYRIHNQIMNLTDSVTIFIDAVDQLGNDDQFLWIPKTLPANVKIIISALEDENYPEDSKYFQTLQQNMTNLHEIPEFNDPITLLQNILSHEERTLQEHQESYFLEQFHSSPSPLYISIAAQEMKHWRSDDTDKTLSSTQKGIIQEFITNLSKQYHHNKHFVQKVLGYLYASRDGLSESELLQLISTDEAFIEEMAPETYHDNLTKELPMVHWSRLHTQIKPFLSIKRQDNENLMYFFHREFEDSIKSLTTQKDEHEAIIKATQKLIKKHQHEPFDSNRLGKLYSTLISEYELRFFTQEEQKLNYFQKKKQREFAKFIATLENEEWIEGFTDDIRSHGWNHFLLNRTYQANAFLESSLQIASVLYAANPERWVEEYTSSLNNLVYSYGIVNRIEEAMALGEKGLSIRETLYAYNPERWTSYYITALNTMASLYRTLNRMEEAMALEEKAFSITEALYAANPERWAEDYTRALNELVESYVSVTRINEAGPRGEEALSITEALYATNPDRWAERYTTALLHLSILYRMINQIEEAIALSEKLLFIREALYAANPELWASYYITALNNLAICYNQVNRTEEAMVMGEKLLSITEALYAANPDRWATNYSSMLNNLAVLYGNVNRTEEAITLSEKALSVREALYAANPERGASDYITALNILGASYGEVNRIEEAMTMIEKALFIAEALYASNTESWAVYYTNTLHNLAGCYEKVNRIEETIVVIEKLLSIYEALYASNPEIWAEYYTYTLHNLAGCYEKVNRIEETIVVIEKLVFVIEALYASNPYAWRDRYVDCLHSLANLYYSVQRSGEAMDLEQKANNV